MIKELIYVGIGGFAGSVLRYLVSVTMKQAGSGFPWGTFTVNVVGCFAIGLLGGWISRSQSLSPELGLLLTVGVCGGFTTFSTFSREALTMLQNGNYLTMITYIAGSLVLGIAAVWLGLHLTSKI